MKHAGKAVALLGGTVLVLAAVASIDGNTVREVRKMLSTWKRNVLAWVVANEGAYTAINRNTDGAGLSVGLIQWAQAPGGLGTLLAAWNRADSERFARIFGPSSGALLAATASGGVRQVDGVSLWNEPWLSRFRVALADPVFKDVQLELATGGEHWKGAEDGMAILAIPQTERAWTLLYDRAVQQGPGWVRRHAKNIADAYPVSQRLTAFARSAASAYRRTSAPTEPYPNPRLEWRQVGNEWHVFAGRIDLYADITRRVQSVLASTKLSDAAVV